MAFVQAEKERVEGFQWMYTFAQVLTTVCLVLAMGFIWFTGNRHMHAIAIALMLFSVSLITIDYFSKERASVYYETILPIKPTVIHEPVRQTSIPDLK